MVTSAFWLSSEIDPTDTHYFEDPLNKQPLALNPGEFYRYSYIETVPNQSINGTFTYVIYQFDDCTAILTQESRNRTPICLNRQGTDVENNNLSLSNPFIYMFKPWMLALNDTWEWKTTAYLSFPTENVNVSTVNFKVVGKELILGRMAYKVSALYSSASFDQEILYWVDQEKRILLMEKGISYEIQLIDSSFTDHN
jgi:hypothetical protein